MRAGFAPSVWHGEASAGSSLFDETNFADKGQVAIALGKVDAVAHNEHSVIELLATCSCHHSAGVKLERALVGLDGHGDGFFDDRCFQARLVSCSHVFE